MSRTRYKNLVWTCNQSGCWWSTKVAMELKINEFKRKVDQSKGGNEGKKMKLKRNIHEMSEVQVLKDT